MPHDPKALLRFRGECPVDFSTVTVAIGDVEHEVHQQVAEELNRLRIASMGSAQLVSLATTARNEALDLLAEILGPTTGPMTMPSAAALEAWAKRARDLLAQREDERGNLQRSCRAALPISGVIGYSGYVGDTAGPIGGHVDPVREG